ncbi:hypothetical protein [Robertmurraya sp. Marseille-Q9965]
MPQKEKWVGFFICMITVLYLQVFLVQPIYANVEDIQTDGQNIHETDLSDGKGESVGGGGEDVPWWKKAWNKAKDIGNKGIDLIEDIGDSIGDQWNEFLDWSSDAWDSTKDWISDVGGDIGDWFKDVGSSIGEFFSDAWDWIQENEWVQTIVAGILATVVIVVGAFLIVGTWPAWAVIAVVGGLALGAGFLYQWLAGDNYNFFGALGVSFLGGLAGYIGMTTGAFAAGWAWLRHTAGPAAWSWIKGTAVPWVVGRGQAAWGWMRTVALPWIRGKAVAGWRWFKGLPAWGQIKGAYTGAGAWSKFWWGALSSGVASAIVNVTGQMLGDDPFSIKSLIIDTGFGALTGGLLAPVLVPGLVLSGSLIGTISFIGGLENWLGGGLEKGEWLSWQNFVAGGVTSLVSLSILSKIFGKIPNPFGEELATKMTEDPIKNWFEDLLSGNENTKQNIPEKKSSEKPVQTPSEESSKDVIDNQKLKNSKVPTEDIPINRNSGGINPQPIK